MSTKCILMTSGDKLLWKVLVRKNTSNWDSCSTHVLASRQTFRVVYLNKQLLSKQVFKPVRMYAFINWDAQQKFNIKIIQTFQNKVLRSIVNNEDTLWRENTFGLWLKDLPLNKEKDYKNTHPNDGTSQSSDNGAWVWRLKSQTSRLNVSETDSKQSQIAVAGRSFAT